MARLAIPIAGGDTGGASRLLAARLQVFTEVLTAHGARQVLDGGCGSGDYLRPLQRAGFTITGVEYLAEKVQTWTAGSTAPAVVRGSIETLPFQSSTFDAVLLNEVLEHVPNDHAGLHEIARVLAPGGLLICVSPNRLFPFETHGVLRAERPCFMTVPGIPYVPLALGARLWTYRAHNYWPWELRAMIRRAGFRVRGGSVLWLTFEGLTGRRSRLFRYARPLFNRIARLCERLPGVRWLGTSQLVIAEKDRSMPVRRE